MRRPHWVPTETIAAQTPKTKKVGNPHPDFPCTLVGKAASSVDVS
jgi:hypothetical protein